MVSYLLCEYRTIIFEISRQFSGIIKRKDIWKFQNINIPDSHPELALDEEATAEGALKITYEKLPKNQFVK